jgi:DNA-binding LytR/AlgR family response regulator
VLGQRGAVVPVPLREIYFIESHKHAVSVHTGGETVVAYARLEDILHTLPVGFFQCHKSYIVNMSRIRRFQSSDILLKNGERVPVSRARYAETKEAYFNFIGNTF